MSIRTENVIPGEHGKIFAVNFKTKEEFESISEALMELDGVKDVMFNNDVHPAELTIHTEKLVKVKDVQRVINDAGYHAVPKKLFPLISEN